VCAWPQIALRDELIPDAEVFLVQEQDAEKAICAFKRLESPRELHSLMEMIRKTSCGENIHMSENDDRLHLQCHDDPADTICDEVKIDCEPCSKRDVALDCAVRHYEKGPLNGDVSLRVLRKPLTLVRSCVQVLYRLIHALAFKVKLDTSYWEECLPQLARLLFFDSRYSAFECFAENVERPDGCLCRQPPEVKPSFFLGFWIADNVREIIQ
jgi:hypothetical protein